MSVTKVVILNWNGELHLKNFLPSVVATTPENVQIVVADNGSDDGSLALLSREFPQVGIVELDRNYGFADGYNRALRQIKADYYILLNSDVQTSDGWCERLIQTMDTDPTIAALAPKLLSYADKSQFEYAGASGGFIDVLGYPFCRGRILSTIEQDHGQYDTPCEVFWASGAALMFRASIFHELGGFDARFFAHMEEIDLCWRAQLAGYRVSVEPRSVVYHLGGGTLPNNTPRKLYLNFRNNLVMLYKNLPPDELFAVMFTRMILDAGSALVYLLQGNVQFFRAVWDAHIQFHRWHAELKSDRKRIQSNVISRPVTIYRGSIILRYMFGGKRFGNML